MSFYDSVDLTDQVDKYGARSIICLMCGQTLNSYEELLHIKISGMFRETAENGKEYRISVNKKNVTFKTMKAIKTLRNGGKPNLIQSFGLDAVCGLICDGRVIPIYTETDLIYFLISC